jgi:hypothetical protein
MAHYIHEAFHRVCLQAKAPETWYVCLMEKAQFYGGPEEGGWWGTDTFLSAYQEFPTEEAAEAAAEEVRKLADELSKQSRREHGRQCLRETEWLEARGLDADYLPEPDGPSEYHVLVSRGLPEGSRGCRQYS